MLVMHLLRDTSPHISMDAFHVFKVFVANPNKPPEVVKILQDNQVKLCRYLTTLHQDKEASDTQFRDEKALIIATIEGL
jgi:calcium binding protein 39